MDTTKNIGNRGEEIASQLLTAAGYAIVERNAHIANIEIDIVAQHHNRIIMVEVKTRKGDSLLDPDYGIDSQKLRRLARAADIYIRSKNLPHEAQIDVILITNLPNGTSQAEHLQDVCLPPARHRR